jgi:tetratricopeptide (TPR) repeat protein
MITEEREALRLNPNNTLAHFGLGGALERKGDGPRALEEYRVAYTLDPKNALYKQNYERLVKKTSQSSSNGSPISFLALLLSVIGAIADWQYRRAGGKPSSRRDKILFFSIVLLVAGTMVVLGNLDFNQAILGHITVPLALWLFFAWELGRWRMRRKYPLPKPESDSAKPS